MVRLLDGHRYQRTGLLRSGYRLGGGVAATITQTVAPVLVAPTAGDTAISAYTAGTTAQYTVDPDQTLTVEAQMQVGGSDVADGYVLQAGDVLQIRITVTAADGTSRVDYSEAATTIAVVLDPGDLILSSSTVSEGASTGAIVGTISGAVANSTLTMSDDAGGLFALPGSDLVTAGALDYETAATHDVVIAYSHPGASTVTRTFTITVANVNEVILNPADISLSNATVPESASSGDTIGALSGMAAGSSLSMSDDAGGRVALNGTGDALLAGVTGFDHEAATSHDVVLTYSHPDAAASEAVTFTISVTNVNEVTLNPADIGLTSSSVAEDAAVGATVGTLTGKAAGSTLTLTGDAGGLFSQSGDDILTAGALDYETATSHDITLDYTHPDADPEAVTLTISVTNVAEGNLGALTLSSATVAEDASVSTFVGAIQGLTSGSSLALVDDAGGLFDLSGSDVVTAGALDYETSTTHDITLREALAEASNSPRETTLTISVANVAENTLSALSLSNATVSEDAPTGTTVGSIQGATGGSSITLTDDAGGRFALSGSNVVTGATGLDYETATSHSISLRESISDAVNSPRDTVLTINVTDVAEATPVFEADQWAFEPSLTSDAERIVTIDTLPSGTISSVEYRTRTNGGAWTSWADLGGAAPGDYTIAATSALETVEVQLAINGSGQPSDTKADYDTFIADDFDVASETSLLTSNGGQWLSAQIVGTGAEVSMASSPTPHAGTHFLYMTAPASGNPGKAHPYMETSLGQDCYLDARCWFYFPSGFDPSKVWIMDVETKNAWDPANADPDPQPNIRIGVRESGDGREILWLDRSKIGQPLDPSQSSAAFDLPRDQWVEIRWVTQMGLGSAGWSKIYLDGALMVDFTGTTKLPEAEYEAAGINILDDWYYDRWKLGITARSTPGANLIMGADSMVLRARSNLAT